MAIADVTASSLAELLRLTGRIAVVTGGGRGLGKAIARRLAEAGAALVLGDINEQSAREAAQELSAEFGVRALGAQLDVTQSASITALADRAVAELGALDIWVNNAGIFPVNPVLGLTDEDWDRVLSTNLRGTFIGCREAARRMIAANRPGVIVNIASIAGYKGAGPGIPHYVASKHGVRGITRQLALELADRNIRVLAVAPTTILTEGVRAVMPQAAAGGFGLDQTINSLLGRTGVPDDVARVVLFCASDLSIFMTGSTLPVDAGELTR
jgi:NAD(P)-dependent dehydrogenase (short-subunit alcohol dehydrogenase family)